MKTAIFFTILSFLIFIIFTSFQYSRSTPITDYSILVKLTDQPANYSALYVEIQEIDIYGENQGWIKISDQRHYINVLSLTNGTEVELANFIRPPEDTYSKLMIRFGDLNSIYIYGDLVVDNKVSTISKTLVWRGSKEIYIPIFNIIPSDTQSEILLDFNVSESITAEGENYIIKPIITTIEDPQTGISGNIQGASMISVVIFNDQNSYSTYVNPSGDFLIRGMEPGVYNILITPNQICSEGKLLDKKCIPNITISESIIYHMNQIIL